MLNFKLAMRDHINRIVVNPGIPCMLKFDNSHLFIFIALQKLVVLLVCA